MEGFNDGSYCATAGRENRWELLQEQSPAVPMEMLPSTPSTASASPWAGSHPKSGRHTLRCCPTPCSPIQLVPHWTQATQHRLNQKVYLHSLLIFFKVPKMPLFCPFMFVQPYAQQALDFSCTP